MILRRVIQHFRKQEWTAIAIDLVIVVVGVVIGIQVANWNEARIERELVRGHLSEIAQDLQRHLDFGPELEGSARLRIAAVDYIYQQAFGTRLPSRLILATVPWDAPPAESFPPEQLDHLMGAVNLVRVSVRSRNGYESLTSSGRLALLRNRELARQIQTYYGNYDDLLDTQTSVFRAFRNDGASQQYAIGVSVFDQRSPAEIVALARDNPAFAAYLRAQREWAILHYNLLHNVDVETKALLAAIETELAAG
jgi:hypothetical protein